MRRVSVWCSYGIQLKMQAIAAQVLYYIVININLLYIIV